MRGLLRAPALHFIALGALLFALWPAPDSVEPGHAAVREPIVITAERRAQIRDMYTRETGLAVTANDEKALLEREIREELLYREALAHGLHLHDRSIQWRLVTKMRFLQAGGDPDDLSAEGTVAPPAGEDDADSHEAGDAQTLYQQAIELGLDRDDVVVKRILIHKMRLLIRLQADDDVPDDATLRAFFEEHGDEYEQPPRATFSHVFASRDKRGEAAQADARALLAELAAGPVAPADAVRKADPFPLGHEYRSRSRTGVAKIFGDNFADGVMAAEPERWSGPIESAYGWHLVWVDSKHAERIPAFEMVRSQVFQRYVNERRNAHLERTLAELRDEYDIVIDDDAEAPTG